MVQRTTRHGEVEVTGGILHFKLAVEVAGKGRIGYGAGSRQVNQLYPIFQHFIACILHGTITKHQIRNTITIQSNLGRRR